MPVLLCVAADWDVKVWSHAGKGPPPPGSFLGTKESKVMFPYHAPTCCGSKQAQPWLPACGAQSPLRTCSSPFTHLSF